MSILSWNLESKVTNLGSWTQVGLLLLALVVFLLWRPKINANQPPGPLQYPLIGNIPQLSPYYHRDFEKLGKKYGPLMYLKIGAVPVVVVQDAAFAREILKTHDAVFANRPQDLAVVKTLAQGADLGFSPVGPHWRYLKKVLVECLMKRLDTYKEQRLEEVIGTMSAMMQVSKGGDTVKVRDQMSALMYNVVSRMIAGKTFHGSSNGKVAFRALMVDFFSVFNGFNISDWFPYMRLLGDFDGTEKRMANVADRLNTFLQDCIDEHRSRKEKRSRSTPETEGEQVKDFVDMLLEVPSPEGEKDFGDKNMKVLMKAAFIAGTEAAASGMTWALAELVRHPELLKRAQDELDSVVGRDRLVQEEDLPQLKLLGAIVTESLRLHQSPFLIPRQPVQDCKVGGYNIPSNARVFVSVWAISRDPAVWDRPLEFIPDRFLDHSRDVFSGAFHDYLPFGSGRRMCPGTNFGLLMIQFQLAHIVHLCNYSLPGELKPEDLDMSEAPGFNGQKHIQLEVIASPRLAPEFYAKHLNYKC